MTDHPVPRIVLHDHLDGGLRPCTVLDLCREQGHHTPAPTPEGIAEWFFSAADSGSLPRYLETFDLTVALMQTPEALHRIACEFVADMAADGVVYAETRWAPALHRRAGMKTEEAVAAVAAGLDEGMAAARAAGTPVIARQILCLMRNLPPDDEVVDQVVHHGPHVVGIDAAGPEAGFPLAPLAEAFARVRRAGGNITIHAGEAAGVDSVREALDMGARRLGHGVRVVEDITTDEGQPRFGPVATEVLAQQIPLEVCPTSNLQTGVCPDLASHPLSRLWRHGFAVTVNTDNRLMSRTSVSREIDLAGQALGWSPKDLATLAHTGLEAAFCDEEDRQRVAALLGPRP